MTSSTAEWTCRISLRLIVDERDKPLPSTRNIKFGETIRDKAQVEERIRRAQFAILNPRHDPASFLHAPVANLVNDPWTLSFSSNCISVHISGSGVDDLSFVDLPGNHFTTSPHLWNMADSTQVSLRVSEMAKTKATSRESNRWLGAISRSRVALSSLSYPARVRSSHHMVH